MPFIRPVADDENPELFDAERERMGYVPNYARVLAHRPDVYAAWQALSAAIRDNMDRRRYELATVASARELRSSYCMLAHSTVLSAGLVEPDQLRALVLDHASAGLEDVDVAVMDVAGKVARDATSVTDDDIDRLRDLGLADEEIFDVVAAAAVRCFFSKLLDALGALPDRAYRDRLEPELLDALTIGRPIEDPAKAP